MTDPFAPPVTDEPTLATNSTNLPATDPWASEPKKAAGSITVDVKPNILKPDFAGEHVVTLKGGSGFEAPWYVIHASGLDELEQLFGADANRLAALFARIQAAAAHFASNGPVNTGRGGNTGGASAPPQGATEAPSWAPAKHQPDAVYKTGVSKAGKVWHAWMAPEKGGYDPKFFYQN